MNICPLLLLVGKKKENKLVAEHIRHRTYSPECSIHVTSSLDAFKFGWGLMVSQHLFDFGNGPGGVQMLWTGLGTVHDRMTFEYRVGIIHFFQAFSLK